MMHTSTAEDVVDLSVRHAAISLPAGIIPHHGPFLCELTVHARHLSRVVDHVSNIEIVRWLDRAAELHSDAAGFTRRRLLDEGMMWFVARHEIDYVAEAREHDHLVIATWVRQMHRVKAWRDSILLRADDGAIVCRASTLWVLVDLSTRRPRRIPAQIVQGLDPLTTIESRGQIV